MIDHNLSCRDNPCDRPLLEETIGEAMERIARNHADQLALVVRHQQIRWSYQEYLAQVDKLALGLLDLGIMPGDRVGIWAPNCVEWCLTQFATARIGAIMVCINPAYRVYELEYALNKVQCRAIITADRFKTSDYLGMLRELAPELDTTAPGQPLKSARLPHLEMVIRMGSGQTPGMLNFDAVCARGSDMNPSQLKAVAATLSPDDPINIQFTSGTTGSPKGATLTHRNILNNAAFAGASMHLTPQDKLCIPVPLYHCFGMVMGTLVCLTAGSTAVFPAESFDPLSTLEAVQAESCTALHGVPTMFIAELEHPEFSRFDLGSLRTGIMAGAPCPVAVMNKVIDQMHMQDVLIGYGQTELSPISHMTETDDPLAKRVETVGKPGPHLETKIVNETNTLVPIGERGEICTRGYSVMLEYWDDQERTAETIDSEGWLHSGDIGIMDEDGYVQVVGRIKDMIIRGGENIYPREVEEFMHTHPSIQDVQVFGIPHEKYGEQVCAWVQLQDGAALEEQALVEFCRERITHFKVPTVIRFVNEYPMTVTGKVQKFVMREQMAIELASKN